MADGVYISMNGAAARMAQLDSISDNLANAQTPGFKSMRPTFEAFLANADAGQPTPARVYAAAVSTEVDLSPGQLVQTGDPLDLVPGGRGFFGVQTGDGVALVRSGRLTVDAGGVLRMAGLPLVDPHGEIITAPQGVEVEVLSSGAVVAQGQPIGQLGLFDVQGPVDRIGPSLLAPQDEADVVATTSPLLVGQLELGNSSPLEAAVQLVAAQRQFDTSIQALQTYKRLDERATEVGRVR